MKRKNYFGFVPSKIISQIQSDDYQERVEGTSQLQYLIKVSNYNTSNISDLLRFLESIASDENFSVVQNVYSILVDIIINLNGNTIEIIKDLITYVFIFMRDTRKMVNKNSSTLLTEMITALEPSVVFDAFIMQSEKEPVKLQPDIFNVITTLMSQNVVPPKIVAQYPFLFDSSKAKEGGGEKEMESCLTYISNNDSSSYQLLQSRGVAVSNPVPMIPQIKTPIRIPYSPKPLLSPTRKPGSLTPTINMNYKRPGVLTPKSPVFRRPITTLTTPIENPLPDAPFTEKPMSAIKESHYDPIEEDDLYIPSHEVQPEYPVHMNTPPVIRRRDPYFDKPMDPWRESIKDPPKNVIKEHRPRATSDLRSDVRSELKCVSPQEIIDRPPGLPLRSPPNPNEGSVHRIQDKPIYDEEKIISFQDIDDGHLPAQQAVSLRKPRSLSPKRRPKEPLPEINLDEDSPPIPKRQRNDSPKRRPRQKDIEEEKENDNDNLAPIKKVSPKILTRHKSKELIPEEVSKQFDAGPIEHGEFNRTAPIKSRSKLSPLKTRESPGRARSSVANEIVVPTIPTHNARMNLLSPKKARTVPNTPKRRAALPKPGNPLIGLNSDNDWEVKNASIVALLDTGDRYAPEVMRDLRSYIDCLLGCAGDLRTILAKNALSLLLAWINSPSIPFDTIADAVSQRLLQLLASSHKFIQEQAGECFRALIAGIGAGKAEDILSREYTRKHVNSRAHVALAIAENAHRFDSPERLLVPLSCLCADASPEVRKHARVAAGLVAGRCPDFPLLVMRAVENKTAAQTLLSVVRK